MTPRLTAHEMARDLTRRTHAEQRIVDYLKTLSTEEIEMLDRSLRTGGWRE